MESRITKFLSIGILHSTLYFYLFPKIILPNTQHINQIMIYTLTITISIILTLMISRGPKFVVGSSIYLFRVFIVSLWFAITTLLMCFVFIARPFHHNNSYLYCKVESFFPLWALGIKVIKNNFDSDPPLSPAVYICNHQGILDAFIVGSIYPKSTIGVGKRSILAIPFFGLMYWLAGNILINRKNLKSAISSLKKAQQKILDKNLSVLIFPEGTREKGRELLPFKKGAFRMAIDAQIPIRPLVISYYYNGLKLNDCKTHNIYIERLPEISTQGKTLDEMNTIIEDTFKAMKDKLAQLS